MQQHWGAAWITKHIKEVLAVSGPWGGAVDALKGPVSGDNFHMHFPHNLLHSVQGTSPSGPWLFPSHELWPHDSVIISTRTKNYTAGMFNDLLHVCPFHFFRSCSLLTL
jgi:hypothetical protein